MQTFLPEMTFTASAKALDNKRLGKQRVEVLQLLRALSGESKGWVNHPACKMWRNCEMALAVYGLAICDEWKKRGFADTCEEKIISIGEKYAHQAQIYPDWLNAEFITAHRSNLIRKNPDYYAHKWPDTPRDLPYIWPVK